MVGNIYHILGAGRLADEHPLLVVLLDDAVQLFDLIVHRIACSGVFRVDEHQLPVVAFQNAPDGIRDHILGHQRAHHGFHAKHILDAVHLFKLLGHLLDLLWLQGGIHQQHVGGANIEGILQLGVGNDVIHILRQGSAQVVVHSVIGLGVCVVRRHNGNGEHCKEYGEDPGQTLCRLVHTGQQGTVPGLFNGLIQHQDQSRQSSNASDHAQDYALRHDDAKIHAQSKGHEAQSDEPGNGGDGTADDGGKGFVDGSCHCAVLIPLELSLLTVAVPQEDGVVHGDCQLQYRRQRLGQIGDLS